MSHDTRQLNDVYQDLCQWIHSAVFNNSSD